MLSDLTGLKASANQSENKLRAFSIYRVFGVVINTNSI